MIECGNCRCRPKEAKKRKYARATLRQDAAVGGVTNLPGCLVYVGATSAAQFLVDFGDQASQEREAVSTESDPTSPGSGAAVDGEMDGLEGRVADAVCKRLSEGTCTRNAKCGDGTVDEGPSCPPATTCACSPATTCEDCRTQCQDCPQCPACPDRRPPAASTFTLFYENARLNEEQKVTEESVGVKLAPRHIKRLDFIADAFGGCHRKDAPVLFHVTGFSSTAEFLTEPEDKRLPDSDNLNLDTANLRAKIVRHYLENEGFQVTDEEWKSFESLRRPYSEISPPGTDRQALNRSVFIELVGAGVCDLREIEHSAG